METAVFIALAVVLVVATPLSMYGAYRLGRRLRNKRRRDHPRVERANRKFNQWAARHPVLLGLIIVVLPAIGLYFRSLRGG